MICPIVASALFVAASSISVDAERHRVTFAAEATGLDAGTIIEFMFVGPDSDRDYESMFITCDTVADIAEAFDKAGIPSGGAIDFRACRFWPAGKKVEISPSIWRYVRYEREDKTLLPALYTGGTKNDKGRPVANDEMPCAVFALYSCPQSLIQLDNALDQSVVYGQFRSATNLVKGTRMEFTVLWNGMSGPKPYRVDLIPGNMSESIAAMRKSVSPECGLDVLPSFSAELTVGEAIAAANALSMLDSREVRINGMQNREFFFRAFLPLEQWRDRTERLSQPLEITVSETGTTYTIIDEDWSGEGLQPKLSPRTVDEHEAASVKTDTCLIYAPKGIKLGRLYEIKAKMPNSIRNWYIFGE